MTDGSGTPMAAMVKGSDTEIERQKSIAETASAAIDRASGAEASVEEEANAEASRNLAREVITNASKYAREANARRTVKSGPGAQLAAQNSASENAEVQRQVDVLTSNAKLETLNAMRQGSSSGASGLGALSENEAKMLADRAGALDPASPYFLRDLKDYEETLFRTVYGRFWEDEWALAYPDGWGETGAAPTNGLTDADYEYLK